MERVTELKLNNRWLKDGTEFSVKGERGGRFRFRYADVLEDGTPKVITGFGGPNGHGSWRSFDPAKLKRIHSKDKMR